MNITEFTLKNRTFSYFILGLIVVCGIFSYFQLGQLEDPDFTVKTAVVLTQYPGASPEEVELEVTDRLEQAIQELPQLKNIYSTSKAGESNIKVYIKPEYWGDVLPQVWDELRKKINDVTPKLPPGVQKPMVADDFGYVYGFLLAISGEDYSDKELEKVAKTLRKELSLVKGVARVELWGVQDKVIYLDVTEQQLAQSGLTPENFQNTLEEQNLVVNAGNVNVETNRMRIAPTGDFKSPSEIGELYLHPFQPYQDPSLPSSQYDRPTVETGKAPSSELIRIRDIAEVNVGYADPPKQLMRFNGKPAIAISLANVTGGNVVETGKNIDKRLNELLPDLPLGIEVTKIAWQSDVVSESINGFFVNLFEAVLIVLVVLTFAMGWRMGIIIGSGLILTILSVFILMAIQKIQLHRISLGALVIALGMMVDNAIVVADGIMVKLKQGMDRTKATIEAATTPSIPLLGATVVALMAFYPIYASEADTGEYAGSLYVVVALSLMMSWIIAMTLTPLQCYDMLPIQEGEGEKDSYTSPFFVKYRQLLELTIRRRWGFLLLMIVLLVTSVLGFGFVKQLFFPDSSRPQLMVDFWYPEGTRIQDVGKDIREAEQYLEDNEHVINVSSFIGSGPPRFYLPVDPESPNQNYAQIIVNTPSFDDVNALIGELEPWLIKQYPEIRPRVRKFGVGPGHSWKLDWRISGPAVANLETLRKIGNEGIEILKQSPETADTRLGMMNQVMKIVPEYDQARGRWTGIQRKDIAAATKRAQDGINVGLYREGDDLYPILLRHTEPEREKAMELDNLQIKSPLSNLPVPLSQVTKDIQIEWENPIIERWNRRRTVSVQAAPKTTYPSLKKSVINQFENMKLPPHYEMFMAGEDESARESQQNLVPGIIPTVVIMAVILVGLFNAIRPPLIIVLTIPFAAIGITLGLLVLGKPFGFMALLGGMSLAGMMIKNAVVLLDQINIELAEGRVPYDAVITSCVSRLRPVLLGAVTTVLGVIPLYTDVFWESMTVTIMGGLSFGTILTMFLAPVLYCILFKVNKS